MWSLPQGSVTETGSDKHTNTLCAKNNWEHTQTHARRNLRWRAVQRGRPGRRQVQRRPARGGSGRAASARPPGRRTTRSSGARERGGARARGEEEELRWNGGAGCCDCRRRRRPARHRIERRTGRVPPGGWDQEAWERGELVQSCSCLFFFFTSTNARASQREKTLTWNQI